MLDFAPPRSHKVAVAVMRVLVQVAVVSSLLLGGCRRIDVYPSDYGGDVIYGPDTKVSRLFAESTDCRALVEAKIQARKPSAVVVGVAGCGRFAVYDCTCRADETSCYHGSECSLRCRDALEALAVAPSPPTSAPEVDPDGGTKEARRLSFAGQQAFDEGRYVEAARLWAGILDVLVEAPAHREERLQSLLVALEAYRMEYEPEGASPDASTPDPRWFSGPYTLHRRYLSEFEAAYGTPSYPDVETWTLEFARMAAELASCEPTRTGGDHRP